MTHGQPAAAAPKQDIGARTPGIRTGSADRDRIRGQRRVRAVLAALLLMLTAAGVRAAGPSGIRSGPLRQDAKPVGLALELALIALLVAVNRQRARLPEPPPHLPYTLNSMLRFVLRLGVIALPVAAVLSLARTGGELARLPACKHPCRKFRGRRPHHLPAGGGHLWIVLLIVVLAGAVICAVLSWAWRRRPAQAAEADALDDDFSAKLSRAVESGLRALATVDDARTAIIACYLAMEASLAEAGAVRAAAETPDELLARASAGELVRGSAAGRLTALFYQARFSARPLPQANRAAAQLALTELAGELGGTLEAELAAGPGAGPGSAAPAGRLPGRGGPESGA